VGAWEDGVFDEKKPGFGIKEEVDGNSVPRVLQWAVGIALSRDLP